MKSRLLPFYLLSLALFIGLILPVLIQDGMFMDGLLYTCVAKNLGNGIGTFWFPISEATWLVEGKATFHEHPPLVFAIQSVFFKLLGNSMYTERIYSFLTACITAFLIILIWKETFKSSKDLQKYYWLPVLLWIIVPVAHWTFQNNMQENTMGIFCLLAILFIIKGMYGQNLYLNLCLSGIFIFLASFSKGVPGLFPLVTIGLYWIVNRKPSLFKTIIYTLTLILIPLSIYFILIQNQEAKEALSFYLNYRLLGRIENAHTVSYRFKTITGLFSHLLPLLLLSAILLPIFIRKSIKNFFELKREFFFFILIGLSASLPLMLTLVQKDFYFSHSIPFFGLAFAMFLAPGIQTLVQKIDVSGKGFKIFRVSTVILLVVSFSLSIYNIGGQSRDSEELNDVYIIGKIIPKGTIIGLDKTWQEQYSTRYYLVRYFNISSSMATNNYDYLLLQKENNTRVPVGYQKVELSSKKYDLYKKLP
jgi:4-amino-4-deoxy-L-arabinose transferase-like glycosyltransferase